MLRLAPLALLFVACTSTPMPSADGGSPDATRRCARDEDCSDGLFCNGVEHCTPTDPHANAQGCVAATGGPCAAGMTCNEAMLACQACLPTTRDADGDGHASIACGGDDCDDTDASRFPGAIEVCDTLGHDEDCDPTTYGRADHDHDGYDDARCCDADPSGGASHCGDDCDDTEPSVHPTATEVCNGYDDNCDGMIDEGVQVSLYTDGDHDSYGGGAVVRMACTVPSGFASRGGDCDDTDGARNPDAHETCNGVDENCDGMIDEGTDALCATALGGHGPAECIATMTGASCRPAGCAMGFSDCDGNAANGCEADNCNDSHECNHCGGSCLCVGGGCVGLGPSLGLLGFVNDVGGGPLVGATVAPLFGCQAESATTDATGRFDLMMHVTGVNLFSVSATGYRMHVAKQSFDAYPPAVTDAWFADPDGPGDDPRRGIVVVELSGFAPVPFALDVPSGPAQGVSSGTDVQPVGTAGTDPTLLFFGVAPGPVTVSPVVPVGCSVTCSGVQTWVLPGAVSRVVISACSESCA